MNRHFINATPIPIELGEKVSPAPQQPDPWEPSLLRPHLYIHRITGHMKYTPPEPPKEPPAPSTKQQNKQPALDPDTWYSGPPPAVGWWNASTAELPNTYRYWDGANWSTKENKYSKSAYQDLIKWRPIQLTDPRFN